MPFTPPELPSINCATAATPSLDTLNAQKIDLKSKLSDATGEGIGALDSLMAKIDGIKASIQSILPKPPKLPNFKEELASLSPEGAPAFKEKWGEVPNVDGLMQDKFSGNLDICKDAPNVELQPNGEIKEKAQESTVPVEDPEPVKEKEPTIIEKEKEPPTGAGSLTRPYDEVKFEFAAFIRKGREDIYGDIEKEAAKKHKVLAKKKVEFGKTKKAQNITVGINDKNINDYPELKGDYISVVQAFNDYKEVVANKKVKDEILFLTRRKERISDVDAKNAIDIILNTADSTFIVNGDSVSPASYVQPGINWQEIESKGLEWFGYLKGNHDLLLEFTKSESNS
jgi:hypothetical protein